MRKIGIHSFVWTNGASQADLERAIERSAEHGYGLIELSYLRPETFDLKALGRKASQLGLDIAVTMGLPQDADVSSADPAVAARGRAVLDDAVRITQDLGALRLGGILFSKHGKYDTMPTRDGWMRAAEAVAKTAELAAAGNVQIVLEVVNRFESNLINTTAQGLAFIRETGRDDVLLHLDTFHMNIEEPDPAGAIRLAGDKLGYFHFNENYRGALGTGTIGFPAIFDALVETGYAGDIVFESFSRRIVDEALCLACGIWRDTWDDNGPLAEQARRFIEMNWQQAVIRRNTLRSAESV
ncbi:sugar phosphate isomerase/epimerase family protein [Aureimonas frigidaquae]|uniref:sugar phosphate isomerase/epimerase family protein n=1 Tax=Aureimonas frigidaquae TaxID=424757 RepID=UPI000780E2EA|nr:sugar phosphate isomerase/epimerase [Aureimonas frigidaquae]